MRSLDANLPPQVSRDLRIILIDGVAWSLVMGFGELYLQAFAQAIGAGQIASGLIATIPLLVGALLQLASPWAVRKLASHRRWVVLCVTLQALSFLPLVAAALVGHIPVVLLFAIASLYYGAGMAAGSAWSTWVGTLVPAEVRTRFFAWRGRLTQTGMLVGFAAGGLLLAQADHRGAPLMGFAILFALAGVLRFVSSRLIASQSEPAPLPDRHRRVSLLELARRIRGGPDAYLIVYMICVTVTSQIAAPYFAPYMLKVLALPYDQYAVLVATLYGAKILALPALGVLAHKGGVRRLLWIGGLGVVPLAGLWCLSQNFFYLLGLQAAAGVAWGAYELATFLLFFEAIRQEERTSVLTSFYLLNAFATVGGSLLGAALLDLHEKSLHGYMLVFLASTVARVLSLILLARFVALLGRPAQPPPEVIADAAAEESLEATIAPRTPE